MNQSNRTVDFERIPAAADRAGFLISCGRWKSAAMLHLIEVGEDGVPVCAGSPQRSTVMSALRSRGVPIARLFEHPRCHWSAPRGRYVLEGKARPLVGADEMQAFLEGSV